MKTTAPKPFVFVLMPFLNDFHDVYQLGIKEACAKAEVYCERVDEQVYDGTVLDRIYSQIANADFIVADMTGKNPNVFYEVGYAHALDKRVILLTQNVEDIPFDLKSYPHIVYSNVSSLQEELKKRLTWLTSHPSSQTIYFQFPLRFLSDGRPLEEITELKLSQGEHASVNLEIDILNTPERIISTVSFRLGILSDAIFNISDIKPSRYVIDSYATDTFKQSDGRLFHLIQDDFILLPGGLQKLHFSLHALNNDKKRPEPGDTVDFTLRILTEAGVNDIPLTFTLN